MLDKVLESEVQTGKSHFVTNFLWNSNKKITSKAYSVMQFFHLIYSFMLSITSVHLVTLTRYRKIVNHIFSHSDASDLHCFIYYSHSNFTKWGWKCPMPALMLSFQIEKIIKLLVGKQQYIHYELFGS